MKPHVKEILIGLILGLCANVAGTLIYIVLFSEYNLTTTLKIAIADDFIGKLVTLGAILNFALFFFFIRNKKLYRARGVLMATVIAALAIMIHKFL